MTGSYFCLVIFRFVHFIKIFSFSHKAFLLKFLNEVSYFVANTMISSLLGFTMMRLRWLIVQKCANSKPVPIQVNTGNFCWTDFMWNQLKWSDGNSWDSKQYICKPKLTISRKIRVLPKNLYMWFAPFLNAQDDFGFL